jgi:hypothetical protein
MIAGAVCGPGMRQGNSQTPRDAQCCDSGRQKRVASGRRCKHHRNGEGILQKKSRPGGGGGSPAGMEEVKFQILKMRTLSENCKRNVKILLELYYCEQEKNHPGRFFGACRGAGVHECGRGMREAKNQESRIKKRMARSPGRGGGYGTRPSWGQDGRLSGVVWVRPFGRINVALMSQMWL